MTVNRFSLFIHAFNEYETSFLKTGKSDGIISIKIGIFFSYCIGLKQSKSEIISMNSSKTIKDTFNKSKYLVN